MYAYSNDGRSMRSVEPSWTPMAGEVFFDHQPTEDELQAAFPGRAEALATAARVALQLSLTKALEDHYDSVAHEKLYDDRKTCALRGGYAGPFQAEGAAFGLWMDTCNVHGYKVIADVNAGIRTIPTAAELIAEMPAMVWPS